MTFQINRTKESLSELKTHSNFRFFDILSVKSFFRRPKSSAKFTKRSPEEIACTSAKFIKRPAEEIACTSAKFIKRPAEGFASTFAFGFLAKTSSNQIDRIPVCPRARLKTGTAMNPSYKTVTMWAKKDHTES